ncbi:EscU/YscU/HrcU family type III secretion system export apparatus switch protein [Telmatospirillum sp. J64-1]|uniref:EscU/YscU/HrcU family type III secretion system export apparatus switch protein n=1 Tax=Telmatospirillum sp. J64-1 TaxID=2502183 RepID=UPI0021046079|nr:EscU/YscU/HrcU family type III secretion system export apparatus switch protein [Telmatospirillum sp. J64-1]
MSDSASHSSPEQRNIEQRSIAVALAHDPEGDSAPRVVASGRGSVAAQILEIAFANGVKVRQDADLAEILAALDIDSEIPVEAFAAVAEILAYVYKANAMADSTPPGRAGEP